MFFLVEVKYYLRIKKDKRFFIKYLFEVKVNTVNYKVNNNDCNKLMTKN